MDRNEPIIRPVRIEDEAAERRFFSRLSPRARRLRFHGWSNVVSDGLIHFYTHVDQDRHAAFVCEDRGEIVGEARYVANPDGPSCELGIVVADDWHHTGIAHGSWTRSSTRPAPAAFEPWRAWCFPRTPTCSIL